MIKYDSYKSSGIEWLGEIPSHWENKKIKYIFKIKKQIAGKLGFDILSITQKGIKIKDIESGGGQLSMDYSKYQLVKKGDFAMNHMDLLTGYVDISKYDGVTSPDYRVFYLTEKESDSRYFLYLMQMGYQNKIFYAQGQGSSQLGRWRFASEEFNNFFLPLPPKNEQEAIANFLDKKLEQVDNYISKQKELIELLKEKKSSLINQAVTKGLDSKVEYKESGIEWLGKIPKHWEVIKIKRLIKYTVGGIWGNEKKLNSSDIICVRVADMDYNNFNFSDKNLTIRNILHNERNNRILKKGDLIIEKSGGGEKTPVGRVVKFNLDYDAVCSNFMNKIKIIDKKIISDFLVLMFHILYINKIVIDSIKQTTGIQNLDINSYLSNLIPIPPKNEQKQIVDYIEKESSKIDKVINTKEDEIKLLDEYKQSLISSTVTGKIKVS
ncbi:restriction endonuclease subunit S [Arcobacter sp. CECT 8983]|uniref:restriction endonuclease subunit S n=1 Tax=Arcobacter sp. CECT 8983 TaxID=2044508 RepID=UPI0013E93D06|nr:restriction endonuclease subunit S [Arcobacter sp. CECT 8983]